MFTDKHDSASTSNKETGGWQKLQSPPCQVQPQKDIKKEKERGKYHPTKLQRVEQLTKRLLNSVV